MPPRSPNKANPARRATPPSNGHAKANGHGKANGASGNGHAKGNGHVASFRARSDREIRVAIVGVGNCASSLVQGVEFYRDASARTAVPGLMHPVLGGYAISSIRFVCGFDVDERKVGHDLAEAVFASPNCTLRFSEVPRQDAPVYMGPVLDGVSERMDAPDDPDRFHVADLPAVDVAAKLREHKVDVMLLYLPVGSQKAVEHYAEAALKAGVAVVNCLPVFIASNPAWAKRFEAAGVPILGDDIKSQVGATIVHRVLTHLFEARGVKLLRTYQLNTGGNTDFLNMLDHDRLASKKLSKTRAVTSQLKGPIEAKNVHIGPSDYVPWLKDNKLCFIRMEGAGFGGVPMNLELRLSVEDSPNSAGVVIDAVRCAKLALDRGVGGPIVGPSSYFFKHPPQQFADSECQALTEAFINDTAAKKARPVVSLGG